MAVGLLLCANRLPAALRVLTPADVHWFTYSNFIPLTNTGLSLGTNLEIQAIHSQPDADGIISTGVGSDLAIRGPGWFVVRVPDRDEVLYTRAGDFRLDSEGHLITNQGYRVQGFNEPSRSVVGDIVIDSNFIPLNTAPGATMTTFDIQKNGAVRVWMSDGTIYTRAQILLQKFSSPDELERIKYHLFAGTPAARASGLPALPGSAGLGEIASSALDTAPLPALLKPLPKVDFANALVEGAAVNTGNFTDLAVRGPGAFLVRDSQTGKIFATRAGAFLWDREGFLITYDRKRVQGYLPFAPGWIDDINAVAYAPATTAPTAEQAHVSIDQAGQVTVGMTDGTWFVAGQIILYDFHHPEQLTHTNLGQFSGVAAAQPYVLENVGRYGRGFSRIEAGRLELINVSRDLLARRQRLNFFPQGALVRTGVPSNLAVDGEGFFQLKNPRNGQVYVTRRGDFRVDSDGYLISAKGLRVQGFSNSFQTELGDLRIDSQWAPATTDPYATFVFYTISRDGCINVHMSDGTAFMRARVLLQRFREAFLLRPMGGGLYGNLAAASPQELATAGTSVGNIESSALELPAEREQLTLPPRNGFRLSITGEPGSKWTIQATENFSTWKTICTITNAAFESEFCDRDAKCHPRRFYRVLAEYPVYVPRTYSGPTKVLPVDFSVSSRGIPGLATELQGRNPHRSIYHWAPR